MSEASTSAVPPAQPARKAPKQRIVFSSSDPAEIIASNTAVASPFQVLKHTREAARNWDIFYKNHEKVGGDWAALASPGGSKGRADVFE